jgi:hypothetical protein
MDTNSFSIILMKHNLLNTKLNTINEQLKHFIYLLSYKN